MITRSLIATSSQFGKDPDIAEEGAIKDIVVYDGFISRLRALCEEFYRNTAVAGGLLGSVSYFRDKAFRRDQDKEMQRLWQELSFPRGLRTVFLGSKAKCSVALALTGGPMEKLMDIPIFLQAIASRMRIAKWNNTGILQIFGL